MGLPLGFGTCADIAPKKGKTRCEPNTLLLLWVMGGGGGGRRGGLRAIDDHAPALSACRNVQLIKEGAPACALFGWTDQAGRCPPL